MKQMVTLLLSLMLLCSAWTVAAADDAGEPEIEKPVEIAVVDETGEAVADARVRITDGEDRVIDTWDTDGSAHVLFLKEGEYFVEYLSVPDGYLAELANGSLTVELTDEESATDHVGVCTLDHSHTEICSNSKHVGLELYEINGSVAFCINHGRNNPTSDSRYKMLTATPELLYTYALNKSDGISAQELYDHVLGIIYAMDAVQTQYGLDDTVTRYLAYMAIKNFTDPKCFYEFNDDGESLLVRDENGRPVRDEDGKYVFAEGGTVLGAMMHHAISDTGTSLPDDYVAAYCAFLGAAEHPDNYYLYLYYPIDFNQEDGGTFQCLLSARQVEPQAAVTAIRSSVLFEITSIWDDRHDKDHMRPSAEALVALVHLYADGEDVTELYRDRITVEQSSTSYAIRIADLPKRNGGSVILYTFVVDPIDGYTEEQTVIENGASVTFVHDMFQLSETPRLNPIKPIPVPVPIKPVKPIAKSEQP